MATKPSFPGFTALSDQIFVREGEPAAGAQAPKDPRVIIIFGWGDAQPKHVTKYADGFGQLFPGSKQIAVLAPIYQALWRSMEQRVEAMKPILDATFPSTSFPRAEDHDDSVLVQVMSNTGGINYAALLHAYEITYGKPFPHRLVTFDSTPGSTDLTFDNLGRLSLAMALGTASWFPWPFVVTQCIWGVFLFAVNVIEKIVGQESAAVQSIKAVQNPKLQSKQAKRLYLYGKQDRIILWSDIEKHIAEARVQGYESECCLFEGSGHIEHMRKHPEAYWGAIQAAWAKL
ncbi:hypothetical protein ARAM_002839 [Aspergillus rambellii]|uniref:DUF829 domain protein n=1 Tax=Aspergillus rambellii TaxID=308745 RepID=A0A0F8U5L4_9EURO|nr:hypothetical protein ARAM_002839 [Aspergillus rambellii]